MPQVKLNNLGRIYGIVILYEIHRVVCLGFGMSLLAVAIFLSDRRRYGALAALTAIGIGSLLGFAFGLVLIFWSTLESCGSLEDVWISIKIDGRHVLQDRGIIAVLCAFAGMLASWYAMRLFGRRRIG